ncbi:Peptidase C60 sortase A and B [Modestobacter italicus]|uniref:Peptidase C60 sortase A and B n=1 Tax=Modestobacter italicus (strain DSM 44449 / CECT 9708 / BC 501) TaxID=2732864 RepID=I4F1R6_MODI5|nr:class F sortase [Modestobacter marinus]CCH89579.1 Peptidase C60 sortase A and B [Modestobacter marinus]
MRIEGVYPPPLAPPPSADLLGVDLTSYPRVTRYDRSRPSWPVAARAWTGVSAVLAVAGVTAVVLAPSDRPAPARLDVPVVAAVAPVAVPAGGSSTAPVLQLPASAPIKVRIPALGVTSKVMELGLERDGSMEVPPGAYPVGWYDRSPTPGELGPAVLAGHVDWGGEPGAFYGLRELLPGDQVVVQREDGSTATFAVDRVEEHEKDGFPTDEVYGDVPYAGLRLITCGGTFDEDTGNYEDNVIVFATLLATS